MKKNNQTGRRAILFLLFLFLFFDSQNRMESLLNQYRTVSVRLEKGISGAGIYGVETGQEPEYSARFARQSLGIPEEEVLQVTAWQWEEAAILTEPDLGREVKTALIKVWGDMEEVLPAALKEGSFCTSEDKKGCVIDEETAYKLFGTAKATGNQILIGKKSYRIRGVTEAVLPAAMVVENDRSGIFQQIEIRCENPLKEFASSEGLAVIETPFYMDMVKRFLYLPVWILLFWVAFMGIERMKKEIRGKMEIVENEEKRGEETIRKEGTTEEKEAVKAKKAIVKGINRKTKIWKVWIGVVLALGGAVLVGIGLKQEMIYFPLIWPERYIPSRWSDFSFWGQRIEELKSLKQQLLYLHPCPKDVMLWERLRSLIWELMAEILLVCGFVREEVRR